MLKCTWTLGVSKQGTDTKCPDSILNLALFVNHALLAPLTEFLELYLALHLLAILGAVVVDSFTAFAFEPYEVVLGHVFIVVGSL